LQDKDELHVVNDINGLLSVITGDSIHVSTFLHDKAITLKSDLEKLIKPDSIMRSILNYMKNNSLIGFKNSLHLNFALIYSTCSIFTSENLYSST
jgi:hypothetical protein